MVRRLDRRRVSAILSACVPYGFKGFSFLIDSSMPDAGSKRSSSQFGARYALAAVHLGIKFTSFLPSHTVRNFLLRSVFRMRLDPGATLYSGFELRSPWKIRIAEGTVIGHHARLDGRRGLSIGRNVNLSSEVMIWTLQHDYRDSEFRVVGAEVVIEDYAWIGPRVIVLPGVTIGAGAVVAAGAVVTQNVDSYSVVAGIPAKQVARRPQDLSYSPAGFIVPLI